MLFSNAVGPDGRIAVRAVPKDSWFWQAGLLDPRTGLVELVWPDIEADMFGAWTPDGRVLAVAAFLQSDLWRFTPIP